MSSVHDAHRWPRPFGRTRLATSVPVVTLLVVTLLSACAERAAITTTEQWQLTETLRLGAEEEGPELFDWVKGIEVDDDGGIRIYEYSAQEIRLFDSTGAYVKLLGRKGAGPGELMNAEGIQVTRDGRMWLRDRANGRFTVFDAAGEFEATWPMTYCYSQGTWDPKEDDTGRLLDADCAVKDNRSTGVNVLAYRSDFSAVDTLYEQPECGTRELKDAAMWITRTERSTSFTAIPFAPEALSSLDGNGMLWCVPNSAQYELLRLRPGATDTLRVSRELPAIPVTATERAAAIASLEERRLRDLDFSRIPSFKPLIARVVVDDTRRIWLQRAMADGGTIFDVYTPDGKLVAEVHGGNGRFALSAPFTIRGESLYTVIIGENDVPTVVRFKISRTQ